MEKLPPSTNTRAVLFSAKTNIQVIKISVRIKMDLFMAIPLIEL
jgi:hypothetical protein